MTRLQLTVVAAATAAAVIAGAVGIGLLADGGPVATGTAPAAASRPVVVPDADTQIAFWSARASENPSGYLDYTLLGEAFARKARETGDIGYWQRSEAALRRALDISPGWTRGQALLAGVLFSTHEFEQALDLATPISGRADGVQALATVGDARLALGAYDAARSAYEQLLAIEPDGPAVLARLGTLADLEGDRSTAQSLLLRAANLATDAGETGESLAWYRYQVAELDFRAGRLALAEQSYRSALAAYDGYYLALGGLARVRAALGDDDAAIELYTRATNIVPQPDLIAALGDVYAATGQPAKAEEQYATVEVIGTLAKLNRQVYNRQLALFYADHDRELDKALRLALAELRVRKDVYGYDAAAWASYKNGLIDQAAELSTRALALGTRDAKLLYHAGMIAKAAGRDAQAAAYLRDALALNPHFDLLQVPIARAALAELD